MVRQHHVPSQWTPNTPLVKVTTKTDFSLPSWAERSESEAQFTEWRRRGQELGRAVFSVTHFSAVCITLYDLCNFYCSHWASHQSINNQLMTFDNWPSVRSGFSIWELLTRFHDSFHNIPRRLLTRALSLLKATTSDFTIKIYKDAKTFAKKGLLQKL